MKPINFIHAFIVSLLLAASWTGTARASLIWYGDPSKGTSVFKIIDIEDSSDASQPNPSPNGSSVTVVSDPVDGQVFQFLKAVNDHRCEAHGAAGVNPAIGSTYYIGWSFNINSNVSTNAIFQWKAYGGTLQQNYPIVFSIGSGVIHLMYYAPGKVGNVLWSAPIPVLSTRHTAVLKILVSDQTTGGQIQFWYDGSLQTLTNGQTSYTGRTFDGTSVDPKWGIYGADATRYIDRVGSLRIGTTYNDVAPIGTEPQAAAPTFSPGGGTYSSAQSVTMSTTTSGASIRYTTDGSTPTETHGAVYSGTAVSISNTTTLEAIAYAANFVDSTVTTATYTISLPKAAAPVFNPAGGDYDNNQSVTIASATPGAAINYTTDGTTPTPTTGSVYSGPVAIDASATLQAVASASGYAPSTVTTALYTLVVAPVAFSPAGGTYTSAQEVMLSTATQGATIYYTTNGAVPATSSTRYTGPIPIGATTPLQAIATKPGYTDSSVSSATYTINLQLPAAPAFSPPAGTYTSAQSVTISDATGGAAIHFTTDGNTPTTSSTTYSGPVNIATTTTLKAIAANSNGSSLVTSGTYTISQSTNPVEINDTDSGIVYTGTWSHSANRNLGDYQNDVHYTKTNGDSMSYTFTGTGIAYVTEKYSDEGNVSVYLDGVLQTTVSCTNSTRLTQQTVYSNTGLTSGSHTLKLVKASGTFMLIDALIVYPTSQPTVATPTFSPVAGTYSSGQTVSISDATAGASLYYTTDGSTPTTSSTVYSSPIVVSSGTVTIEALGAESGMNNSSVASATYTIGGSSCVTATAGGPWQNMAFASQTGTFTASFDATPSVSPDNALVGLSAGAQTTLTGFACLVRFNSSDNIDARNGGSYAATTAVPFQAGKTYHIRLMVSVSGHSYSIYVTPPGGSEQTVGANFAFRTEQNTVTSLDHWGAFVDSSSGGSGTLTVCNFSVAP